MEVAFLAKTDTAVNRFGRHVFEVPKEVNGRRGLLRVDYSVAFDSVERSECS